MKSPLTVEARFMEKVVKSDDGCWLWAARRLPTGYGQFWLDGKKVYAHRWAFENLGDGTLIPSMVLDHLCRNRGCVNPDHLEQVTNRENILRGIGVSAETCRTGTCKRGHSMDDAIVKKNGRRCRTCDHEDQRRYKLRRKAADPGESEPVTLTLPRWAEL